MGYLYPCTVSCSIMQSPIELLNDANYMPIQSNEIHTESCNVGGPNQLEHGLGMLY